MARLFRRRYEATTARSRTAVIACALALVGLAGGVSAPSAQTGAAPALEEPSPEAIKLKPFPVITIAGRVGTLTTRVTVLSIRGPQDARVRMRCPGDVCPVRRVRNTIGSSMRLRLRRAERTYRAGTAIEIRVTGTGDQADRVGKYTKVKFRSGRRTPQRTDACLQPGATEPSPCPAG